ncbi:LuxR C-terminal-related transcriptional regulator, partial [Pricia sp.]|uniref:helix-turn-helix domain-containing protein n=1 Tax=Pricia sp. TaxID=2268138 RepID=UPI003593F1B3
YLAKLDIDHLQELKFSKEIAWSPIMENGSFSFDRKHISDKNAIYRLYVKRMEKAITDTVARSTAFILSRSDTILFHKADVPFGNYTNSNVADKEWRRMREFERQLLQSQLAEGEAASQLKSYAKDSLRILVVKLIGVRELEEKQLLDYDIAKNPDFYLALLDEMKESDMPPAQYKFLEKKLAFLTQEAIERKYAWSTTINFILGFMVLGLGALLIVRSKRRSVLPDLSRQERNIQTLILEGKSNKEIANELFISLSTVKTHITNIYSKLKVSDRRELLRRFQN